MRFPKPFFLTSKDAWYVQLGKRQISLGKDRDEAFERYRVLLLEERGKTPSPAAGRSHAPSDNGGILSWRLRRRR